MRGEIAIPKTDVDYNRMGWGVFDFFKYHLSHATTSVRAGWYAYKLDGGIYYFKWADQGSLPPGNYLKTLRKSGWQTSMTAQVIEDAFTV